VKQCRFDSCTFRRASGVAFGGRIQFHIKAKLKSAEVTKLWGFNRKFLGFDDDRLLSANPRRTTELMNIL